MVCLSFITCITKHGAITADTRVLVIAGVNGSPHLSFFTFMVAERIHSPALSFSILFLSFFFVLAGELCVARLI